MNKSYQDSVLVVNLCVDLSMFLSMNKKESTGHISSFRGSKAVHPIVCDISSPCIFNSSLSIDAFGNG